MFYQRLNDMTKRTRKVRRHPGHTGRNNGISTLRLKCGYLQVVLYAKDKEKRAFFMGQEL